MQYFSDRARSPHIFTETETQCADEIEKQPIKLPPKKNNNNKEEDDDHCENCSPHKKIKTYRSQNVYVQTNITEVDENIRLNNLMFCKFISHELDSYQGNERMTIMQKILDAFKK